MARYITQSSIKQCLCRVGFSIAYWTISLESSVLLILIFAYIIDLIGSEAVYSQILAEYSR